MWRDIVNKDDMYKVENMAEENYKHSEPWPDNDAWHSYTNRILYKYVQEQLNSLKLSNANVILNAGCGKTTYNTDATIIYMDIIEEYVSSFEHHLVGSIEHISLPDKSVDCVICVGSVVNYVDIQKAISEFSRILKTNGILILEYERSNSAEFLFTKNYAKTIFMQSYQYNSQTHYLWMYNEKFVLQLAEYYNFVCNKKYRYHSISSLFYRLGMEEKVAAKFSKYDNLVQPFSYPFSHNEIFILQKNVPQ